jgi:hypothetical protein
MKDDLQSPRQQLVLGGVFLMVMVGAALDLAFDRRARRPGGTCRVLPERPAAPRLH